MSAFPRLVASLQRQHMEWTVPCRGPGVTECMRHTSNEVLCAGQGESGTSSPAANTVGSDSHDGRRHEVGRAACMLRTPPLCGRLPRRNSLASSSGLLRSTSTSLASELFEMPALASPSPSPSPATTRLATIAIACRSSGGRKISKFFSRC